MANKSAPRRKVNKKRNDANSKKGSTAVAKKNYKEEEDAKSSNGVQSLIQNLFFAFLASIIAVVCSIAIFGDRSNRPIFNLDLTAQNKSKKEQKSSPRRQQVRKASEYDIIEDGDSANDWDESDPKLQLANRFLSRYVCNDATVTGETSISENGQLSENTEGAYCHPLLKPVPQRRTHNVALTHSNHTMEYGDLVMTLPRHLLIWDLDAMRDEFIRRELFGARHEGTGNALDSGAFLAAYLVRKLKSLEKRAHHNNVNKADARLMAFLKILPSLQDLEKTHPTLWAEEELEMHLGRLTISFNLVMGYKSMMHSEYKAFSKVSEEFKEQVSIGEYVTMRLNVISRSFGPGAPGIEEELVGIHGTKTLQEELQFYKDEVGVNLQKGCRAMSPILDMWDHHAKPNVEWRYNAKKRAFIVYVGEKKGIPAAQDIMVSYGKYTDTHLFSKFGFVNGDGSGLTEGSIAILHPILDLGMGSQYSKMIQIGEDTVVSDEDREAQKKTLVNYLRYDDGYQSCISKINNPEGYKLKLLKLMHLEKIANVYDRWVINIAPRDEASKPSVSSDIPITMEAPKFDPKKVKFNGNKIIATCRLIALTVDDYDGNAVEVLENSLKLDNFMVGRQSDALEYRSLAVLSRLTTGSLSRYPQTVVSDMSSISSSALRFQSKEWTAQQIRLGEMQTLESLRSIATSGVRQMKTSAEKLLSSSHPSLNLHRSPCPQEDTLDLLKEKFPKL